MEIDKYGIKLVSVEAFDAEFIIEARTDPKRSRFISATDTDIDNQIKWINEYKKRESRGEEYYFIGIDESGERFGTYRIYNIKSGVPVIGSWVTKPGYNKALNSIKMDIIMKEFVFEVLNFSALNFDVRINNKSVLRYHRMFAPTVVHETELDIFFLLEKEDFYINRDKFFRKIK
ncbi:MAG: GNAT family N-acetyltransferase [Sphingobacterium sp.]